MEWQSRINWPALVEEAKQRRKAQKLTQAKLATLAGVSTPTVSRFESGKTDLLLPTVISILSTLGLVDQRTLMFPEPEARYDTTHDYVLFNGKDETNKTVPCAITLEALEDHFDANAKTALKIFNANRECIFHLARHGYLSQKFEADGSVLVTSEDLC